MIGPVVCAHLCLCLCEVELGSLSEHRLAVAHDAADRVCRESLGGAEGDGVVNLTKGTRDVVEGGCGGGGSVGPG